jgi:SAM-dependent methyltransferase
VVNSLFQVYRRQVEELAPLRRHLFGLLPLRHCRRIVEPGCGTGLLLWQLAGLTGASLTGLDLNEEALAEARRRPDFADPAARPPKFRLHDVTRGRLPEADLYFSSFFLYQLADPAAFLREAHRALAPDGLYAVAGEYDYAAIGEDPPGAGLKDALLESFRREGFHLDAGGHLGGWFEFAGFQPVQQGVVQGSLQVPDRDFLRYQLRPLLPPEDLAARLSGGPWSCVRLAFPVHWGIFRKD